MNYTKKWLNFIAKLTTNDTPLFLRYLTKIPKSTIIDPKIIKDVELSPAQKALMNSFINKKYAYNYAQRMNNGRTTTMLERIRNDYMNTIDYDEAFNLLDKKLSNNNLSLEIICAGGFVLQTIGLRTTYDVDTFATLSTKVRELIYETGEELNMPQKNETWINNHITSLNDLPPDNAVEEYKKYENLTIKIVKLDYLIAMKSLTGRDKDIDDIGLIVKFLGNKDPIGMVDSIEKAYAVPVDKARVLEGYERQYGVEWLAEYYQQHAQELYDW